MMMKITVSLPDSIREFMQYKVQNGGYGTVSEYIRELIRLDQRLDLERWDKMRQPGAERVDIRRDSVGTGNNIFRRR